ncbi:hypothetical protein BC835DRAFT_1372282 [Cytidiella melzeri]|nr:hypothetical protein BC835DRAFT_1372282 [Cytidiella melzeri]
MHAPKPRSPLFISTLLRAANQTEARFQQATINRHPRHATVLGGRRQHRYTPYRKPFPASYVPAAAAPFPSRFERSAELTRGGPRIPYLPRDQQEIIVRGFVKRIHPAAAQLPQACHTPTLTQSASIPQTPQHQKQSPVDQVRATAGKDATLQVLEERDGRVQSGRVPDFEPDLFQFELQYPCEDEGNVAEDDGSACTARKRQVFTDLFPPSPPSIQALSRSPSPSTSDEGYEGSGTDGSETEVDELVYEQMDDTHQVPAYRQRVPIPPPVARDSPPPLPLEAPAFSQQLVPSPIPHQTPPSVLIPQTQRDHLVAAPSAPDKSTNWAFTERKLGSERRVRQKLNHSKGSSKKASDSRHFRRETGAKSLPMTTKGDPISRRLLAEWSKEIQTWYKLGKSLEVCNRPEDRAVLKKRYERALGMAFRVDNENSMSCGVKNMDWTTPGAGQFAKFLYKAKDYAVDERWGSQAVALKKLIEGYWEQVKSRLKIAEGERRRAV